MLFVSRKECPEAGNALKKTAGAKDIRYGSAVNKLKKDNITD